MSLYRTWRPRKFTDLVGQDAIVRTLTRAIESDRLAHAYLFSGPRGSGKTSAAKILARCIECAVGPTATPDDTCEHCESILAGNALDVQEIDAASNRGIDEIRSLRDAVKFAPATMRSKVYIIDEAHMLTKEGANAFLKTLEEPPPYAFFILATTAPEMLPPTILSRCQRYAFRSIPVATMIERMRMISDAEGILIDDSALGAIAYRADGGLRDALTMLEQVAAFANGAIDRGTIDEAFGRSGREFARTLLAASLNGDPNAALIAIDQANDAGIDMHGFIRNTIAEFRYLLVGRINPKLLSRDLSEDDAAATIQRSNEIPQPRVIRGMRLLADALASARASGNPRLEVETAVLRFILQREDPSVDALAARVSALERGSELVAAVSPAVNAADQPPAISPSAHVAQSAGKVMPERPNHMTAIAPIGELSVKKIRSLWQNVRTRAESQKITLKAALAQTTVIELEGATLTLSIPDRTRGELLRTNLPVIEDAIAGVLGRSLDVRVVVANGRPATAPATSTAAEAQ